MRNLKRVLSLALASAMLLGMMVMGAGAADTKKPLTDLDKITNKEAVNLMVDLGIITGKPDGSYGPTEIVDRATMATLIYRVLEASTDASMFIGSNSLADVKGTWAEGAINYSTSLNIVNGDGTNFYPANKVTVVQAAKMLLVSLGYSSELSKYSNDSAWATNIMRDAKAAGLMEGISQTTNAELTRDNAAQMIYNAMMAKTVVAETERDQGVEYLKKYVKNDTTLGYETYNLIKVTGVVDSIDAKGNAVFLSTSVKPATSLANNIKGKVAADASVVGQTVAVFIKGTASTTNNVTTYTFDKVYSSSIAAGTSTVLGTSNNGTAIVVKPFVTGTSKDLTTNTASNKGFIADLANDGATPTPALTVTFYLNGVKVTATTDTAPANGIPDVVDAAVARKGAVVELVDTVGDGYITTIRVIDYTTAKISGDIKTKTTNDVLTVTVPGVTTGYVDAKLVPGYEGLAKNDYVMYYKNTDSGIYTVEVADIITGKVAGRNASNQVKVDGTYYGGTGLVNASNAALMPLTNPWTNFTDEFDFYMDKAGNIIAFEAVTDNATTNYAIVLETKFVSGGTIGNSDYVQAKLFFTDGTTQVVTVKALDLDKNGAINGAEDTLTANPSITSAAGFYTYTVDKNDKYTLTSVVANPTDNITIDNTGTAIVKGAAKFDGTNVGNAKTTFIVEKGTTDKTYSVYTGIANLPSMTATSGKLIAKSSIATYVFLTTATFDGDKSDMNFVYVIDPAKYDVVPDADGKVDYYTTKAIVDGEKVDLKFDVLATWTTKVPTAGFYDFKTSDGIADMADSGSKASTVVSALTTLGNGILNDGTNVYTLDGDSVVYVIEDDAATQVDPDSFTVNNTDYTYKVGVVKVNGNNNNLVETAYILATAKP